MNKYNSFPPEKPLFSASERTVKDIASTKVYSLWKIKENISRECKLHNIIAIQKYVIK